jgi:hypothetical protein
MSLPSPHFHVGQVVWVDADLLHDREPESGESYNVTVREVYGQWEPDGPTMLSVVDDSYGRELDVSADTLAKATIKENK